MQVRDSAIFEKGGCGCRCGGTRRLKNYYKYFYLYFLYIFTIKIFLKNTYYALIHKKRKKNASFGFSSHIQGRFRPFPACFGRISPVRRELKPIRHESSRIGANRAESARIREKKKTQTRSDARATVSDTASRVAPRRTWVRHLWCRVRAF